jgi:hypothetical protein
MTSQLNTKRRFIDGGNDWRYQTEKAPVNTSGSQFIEGEKLFNDPITFYNDVICNGKYQGDGSLLTNLTVNDTNKLPLAGGTMTGPIHFTDISIPDVSSNVAASQFQIVHTNGSFHINTLNYNTIQNVGGSETTQSYFSFEASNPTYTATLEPENLLFNSTISSEQISLSAAGAAFTDGVQSINKTWPDILNNSPTPIPNLSAVLNAGNTASNSIILNSTGPLLNSITLNATTPLFTKLTSDELLLKDSNLLKDSTIRPNEINLYDGGSYSSNLSGRILEMSYAGGDHIITLDVQNPSIFIGDQIGGTDCDLRANSLTFNQSTNQSILDAGRLRIDNSNDYIEMFANQIEVKDTSQNNFITIDSTTVSVTDSGNSAVFSFTADTGIYTSNGLATITYETSQIQQAAGTNFTIHANENLTLEAPNGSVTIGVDNTGGEIILNGTDLLAGSAGGNSGMHLVLTINNTQYKIKLENV